MKFLRKMISMFLVFSMMIGIAFNNPEPIKASARVTEISDISMEICKNNVPIRTEPNANSSVVRRLNRGDIVHVVGYCTNNKGNRFYAVADASTENYCYVFVDNVCDHAHDYVQYAVDGSSIEICRCGAVILDQEQKTELMNAGFADPSILLGGEAIAGLSSAFPEAALIVGGIVVTFVFGKYLIRAIINTDVGTMDITEVELSGEIRKDSFNEGSYYPARLSDHGGIMILTSSEMDLQHAVNYVRGCTTFGGVLPEVAHQFFSIYTWDQNDAVKLCNSLGFGYTYGYAFNGEFYSGMYESHSGSNGCKANYFDHYHIAKYLNGIYKKVDYFHVFFGTCYGCTYI